MIIVTIFMIAVALLLGACAMWEWSIRGSENAVAEAAHIRGLMMLVAGVMLAASIFLFGMALGMGIA